MHVVFQLPSHPSVPANIPPSITKSALAQKALQISAGVVHPPSLHTWPPTLCAASAHSMIADS